MSGHSGLAAALPAGTVIQRDSPLPTREHKYQVVADDLRRRMQSGQYPPGALLPSEAQLTAAYGVSRVTLRKALDTLRKSGAASAQQGYGWFVASAPVQQRLAPSAGLDQAPALEGVHLERLLRDEGVPLERRILDFDVVRASREVKKTLNADRVLRVRRLSVANKRRFARVTIWIPEDLATGMTHEAAKTTALSDLLPVRCGSMTLTIAAGSLSSTDSRLLQMPAESPALECTQLTTEDATLRPVLLAHYVTPANWTEFVVELPFADASSAPSGFRITDRA
jgi:GntR family transcriptional regulator